MHKLLPATSWLFDQYRDAAGAVALDHLLVTVVAACFAGPIVAPVLLPVLAAFHAFALLLDFVRLIVLGIGRQIRLTKERIRNRIVAEKHRIRMIEWNARRQIEMEQERLARIERERNRPTREQALAAVQAKFDREKAIIDNSPMDEIDREAMTLDLQEQLAEQVRNILASSELR